MMDRRGETRNVVAWGGVRRADLLLLAGLVFVTPLFFWPGSTDYNYARCIFLLIAVSLATVVHIAAIVRRAEDRIVVPWLVWPLLGFLAASLLSLLHAVNARVGVESLVVFLAFCQFALLVVNVVRERRDAGLLLATLVASACVVALHALLQRFGVLPGTAFRGANSMIATMGNPDAVAGFLACALLPTVLLSDRARSWLAKAALIVAATVLLAAILLTGQTGVLVGILVALAVMGAGSLIFRPTTTRNHRRRNALARVLLAAIAVVILASFGLQVLRAPDLWKANSGPARSTFWSVGWTMWKENPLTGVGLGNFKIVYPTYEAATLAQPGASPLAFAANPAQAHNDYLQAAAELGTLGVLAVLGLLLVLVASLWKRLRADASGSRSDLLVLCGGVVVFFFHALVGFPAHLAGPAFAAALLLALALSPGYGMTGLLSIRLHRGRALAALVVAVFAGLAVSVLAGRDLAANVLQLQGTRLLQTGHDAAALATLERSMALDFSPRQSYFYLASAQYRLGDYRDALDSLDKCFTRFPDENAVLLYADLAAGLGELDRGMQVIDLLLTTNPSLEAANKARYVRALILKEKGDLSAASTALRNLIVQAPDDEPSYIALGEMLAAGGNSDEARKLFDKALTLVEAALPSAQAAAAGTQPETYSEYARARDRLAELTRERQTILRDLGALPGGP